MRHRLLIIPFGLVVLFSVLSGPSVFAQKDSDHWLRVVTDEESVIDVDRSSLILEQNHVIGARFRTSLLKEEAVPGKSDIKYQTRLDTIQFNTKNRQYKIFESTLLDASGKVILSMSSSHSDDWRPLWGRTGSRLLSAAGQLSPFGTWKVLSYHYASGEPPAKDDSPELTSLIGTDLRLELGSIRVGNKNWGCRAPVFEPRTITNEEAIKRFGNPLNSLGIPGDRIDAIILKCEAPKDFPSQTFVLRLPGDNKALMLWDGVFLEIERSRNLFLP